MITENDIFVDSEWWKRHYCSMLQYYIFDLRWIGRRSIFCRRGKFKIVIIRMIIKVITV